MPDPGDHDAPIPAITFGRRAHRGDYSGAVRRTVTALEVLLEEKLRVELRRLHSDAETEQRLMASRSDFPGRLRQYEKLSGRALDDQQREAIDKIRTMRHEIVHRGRRLTYDDRGEANWCVDIGRFRFNWLENDEPRRIARERMGVRNRGRHMTFFRAEITADGVIVKA